MTMFSPSPQSPADDRFFDLSPTPTAILRLDWVALRVNQAMLARAGLNEGGDFRELIAPLRRREFLDRVYAALAESESCEAAATIEIHGETRFWRIALRAVDGFMIATCRDETEFLALEASTAERRAMDTILQGVARIGAWRLHADGATIEVSGSLLQMFGRREPQGAAEGLHRLPIYEFVELKELAMEALALPENGHVERRVATLAEDGVRRHLRFVAHHSASLSAGGIPLEGVVVDETDLTTARMTAESSKEKLDFALTLAGAAVWELDVERGELTVSGAGPLAQAFRRAPARSSGDWLWTQVVPEDLPNVRAAWKRHLSENTPFQHEYRVLGADRDPRWVMTIAHASRDVAGNLARVLGFTLDVDERKRIELDLEIARRNALAASEAKSRFLANMSHEIRTPLNGVIGIVGALAQTVLSEAQREMVDLVRVSGATLDRLLSDILDFSKMEEGRFDLSNEEFDLIAAVEAAAQILRMRASEKGIGFTLECEAAARGVFLGDPIRFRQVVCNLASNAVKFTERGGVAIRVSVAAEGGPGRPSLIRLTVTDSGIGFDEATAQRLFQRFEQADSSIIRNFGGSGLGLSIVKGLLDLMGGTIHARSRPGEGSEFLVEIPLIRVTTPALPVSAVPVAGGIGLGTVNESGEKSGERPMQILLAEDHPVNRKVVSLILSGRNVALTAAANGAEAVAAFKAQPFDLVLMDMQMPVMDGLTATAEIRTFERLAGRKPVPIVMLTANALPEHRAQARAAGARHYIAKPITPETLIAGIEAALQPDPGPEASAA